MTVGPRQGSVGRNERRVEGFSQPDVEGVIRRKVVPEFPDARDKWQVRIPSDAKIREVFERLARTGGRKLSPQSVTSKGLQDLGVK